MSEHNVIEEKERIAENTELSLVAVKEPTPIKTTRGRKKKVEREDAQGEHIDAVFKKPTYDLINRIVEEENLPTRSALMREAVEFYLNFKVVAKPTDILQVIDEDGNQRFIIPMRMIV